jgi:hypothetical protein
MSSSTPASSIPSSTSNNVSLLDNFVDSISFLPIDMSKNLALMRELDRKCTELVHSAERECKNFKNNSTDKGRISKRQQTELQNEINKKLDEAIDLSEEKVQLSLQCYDMVDKAIRKLDEQLAKFAQLLTSEKNQSFIPKSSSSLFFSSDSIHLPHNEKHSLLFNVPQDNEARISALKSMCQLKSPALSGTTRATRLITPSLSAESSMLTGEEYDAALDRESSHRSTSSGRRNSTLGRSRRQSEDDGDSEDIFTNSNTVITQETPVLDIKLNKIASNHSGTSSSTKKKSNKRSRSISRTDGQPAPQRKRIDLSQDTTLPAHLQRSPVPPPKPIKDKHVQEDHALVSSIHSSVMSIESFNKGKAEPFGTKGAVIGLESTVGIIAQHKTAMKKKKSQMDVIEADLPIDPNEPVYCYCRQVSYGQMIACDNEGCQREWFHFACVGLTAEPKGKWYCPDCRKLLNKK